MLKEIIEEDNPAFADRAYMQRASDDIDARDAGNPLLAVSYVNEMYENFNQLEKELKVKHEELSTGPPCFADLLTNKRNGNRLANQELVYDFVAFRERRR
jgi:hypothetical protein